MISGIHSVSLERGALWSSLVTVTRQIRWDERENGDQGEGKAEALSRVEGTKERSACSAPHRSRRQREQNDQWSQSTMHGKARGSGGSHAI